MDNETFLYRAFISYSHKDQSWAGWLHRKLETYRLPADLVGTANLSGDILPSRLGRFFRDRDDAAAADGLAEEIRRALEQSQNMIVIASPASARSPYVELELQEFAILNAQRKKPGRILTLIIDGEPNAGGLHDSAGRECFPPSLRGGLRASDERGFEPLAADARSAGDGRSRALSKLVAGLLSIRYDSLVRRDIARRRRNRLALGALVVAAAVAVVGVSWQIVSDGREKARLAEVQQRTERDRLTVQAVNDAERARNLLARGNIDSAVDLARESLSTDDRLPFIPQAYNVLYQAYFRGAQPSNVELVSYDNRRNIHLIPIGRKRMLVWSGSGSAAIWSPGTGVTYIRSDLDRASGRAPAVLPEKSVILQGRLAEFRYRIPEGKWDEISYNGIQFDGANPTAQVAIAEDRLIGCNDTKLFEVILPQTGGGDAQLGWQVTLNSSPCSALALGPGGTILVGNWSAETIEFDLAERVEKRRYKAGFTDWISWIDVRGDIFAAVSGGIASIFRSGKETPLMTVRHNYTTPLSPAGDLVIESVMFSGKLEDPELLLWRFDGDKKKVPVNCSCTFQGFDSTGNLLTLDIESKRRATLLDGKTGNIIRELHTFDRPVDNLIFIDDDKFLIGLRELGLETVVPMEQGVGNAEFLPAMPTLDNLLSVQLIDDASVLAVFSRSGNSGSIRRSHDVLLYRKRDGAWANQVWSHGDFGNGPYGYGEAKFLGHGLVELWSPDGAFSDLKGTLRLLAVQDGKELLNLHVQSRPTLSAKSDHLILVGDDDLVVYNLATRTANRLGLDGFGATPYAAWDYAGNLLAAAYRGTVSIWSINALGNSPRQVDAGEVHHLCLASDEAVLAFVDRPNGTFLVRWRLDAEMTETSIQVDVNNEAIANILSDMLFNDASGRAKAVNCTPSMMVIRNSEGRALVWDIKLGSIKVVTGSAAVTHLSPPDSSANIGSTASSIDIANARVLFDERSVSIVDAVTGTTKLTFESDGARVVSAVLIEKRGLVAAGMENGVVQVWNAAAPSAPMITMTAHSSPVIYLSVNPSETKLISGDRGGTVNLWPLFETSELLALFPESDTLGANARDKDN